MDIAAVLDKIIKKNSILLPVILIDEQRLYENYVKKIDSVKFMDNTSEITLTKAIADKNVHIIYLTRSMDLSAVIIAEKAKRLDITPEMLLNEVEELKGKIKGEIFLSADQISVFLKNFDIICNELLHKEFIDGNILKREILLHIMGRRVSSKGLLIQILNGEVTREKLLAMDLLNISSEIITNELSISLDSFVRYDHMLVKVMITYSRNVYKEYGGQPLSDYLLDVPDTYISSMARFIMDNPKKLNSPINELDEIYKRIEPITLTYAIPTLFIKYVGNHIEDVLEIDNEKLWTERMRIVGAFKSETNRLADSLAKNINYQCAQNNIEFLFEEYKGNFFNMDSSFRRVEALYEKLAFLPDFFMNDNLHLFMIEIEKKYHSVITKLNSRLFRNYNRYMLDRERVIKQSEFIESSKFNKRSLFIFADGFRYEMAHELIKRINGYEIEDIHVIGELPSETEVGMNSYFIIDETVELSEKNTFILKKDGKPVFRIYDWRCVNLARKLDCGVIAFEDFQKNKDYSESVIYFFDEADINMHHFDSAVKISEAIDNLENVIRYALGRGYDVVLLSDHGYVNIEKRLKIQDKTISSEKKKSRYLILNKNEDAKEMYYDSTIQGADYLVTRDKKLCFINSTNSLKETSKYNHGGISFQENVITCFIIHGTK